MSYENSKCHNFKSVQVKLVVQKRQFSSEEQKDRRNDTIPEEEPASSKQEKYIYAGCTIKRMVDCQMSVVIRSCYAVATMEL